MHHTTTITLILVFLLLSSNVVWGLEYVSEKSQLAAARGQLAVIVQNKKVLAFQKLFVDKVLKADGTVDFPTRVELQNAVTDIGDDAISAAWTAFLSAKTESDAQNKVKELLSLLASKAYIQ